MSETKNEVYQPMTFDAIKIGLASPEIIRKWSRGEVTKPETINYRTLKPEKDGLFCEKIFGPSKDWECHCGKYKKVRFKGVVCDRCGVEVTKASVRRERMGHIELAAPVSHIWYFKGIPSRMGLLLDISPKVLEKVLYFASYIVLDPGDSDFKKQDVLTEDEFNRAKEAGKKFTAGMGAEAIKTLLQDINLDEVAEELKSELQDATGQKRAKNIKRLEVVEAFRESGNKPEWMIMDAVPVIPPDLRPMVQLEGGRFATSDLNDLYRRIINRNNRLKRLLELQAPDIIVRNEKRMLQEAVDALIDNGRRGRPVTGPGNRALKSLSDMLKGKSGRFRQNLLGKRVDYSGRSVIVVGPNLKIYQCGLPKEMAIELFKPFVMKELVSRGISQNIKNAKKLVEKLDGQVWDVLEEVIREHPVMLNRAPTLHRLGIQAFEPILVEGKAIKLHPLVCTAFNADFDGDQMAVHLPLTQEAQAECRFLLLSPNNLLKPSEGTPVAVPSQDMVLGIYYLTQEREGALGEGKFFRNMNEAIMAYENGYITLHSKIKVRVSKVNEAGEEVSGVVESTLGRFIFNEILPQDLGYVDRTNPENYLDLEVNFLVGKKQLKKILEMVINTHGTFKTAEVLDDIKAMGYHYSTRAAMTVSISDMTVPPQKPEMLRKAQETVDKITLSYRRGLCTDEERYKSTVETWTKTDKELTDALIKGLDKYNNIFMMADSGARGSNQQIKQLAGMRGLMADTTGRTIELPIKSNFREGLDVLEYFISAHGARKGLSDTALRTADSGYLTRRMVDVCQELIIREMDCSEGKDVIPGMTVKAFMDGRENIESLKDRITGRYSCEDIKDVDGNILVKKNHMITPSRASKILKSGVNPDGKPHAGYVAPENRFSMKTLKLDGAKETEDTYYVQDNGGDYTLVTVEEYLSKNEGKEADITKRYSIKNGKLDGKKIQVYVQDDEGEYYASGEALTEAEKSSVDAVKIRNVLCCRSHVGICAKCYGANMATGEAVQVGEAVGIIAAQSIGEPGTQLTMRTFHTGGVAGGDITQGLPRVEELFEARKPKGLAVISEIDGVVSIKDTKKKREVVVENSETGESKTYLIPYGSRIKVKDHERIEAGDELTEGSVNPNDLLKIKGLRAVQDYLLREVQRVYRLQGVDIVDKHIEVIVRQMLKKIRIENNGDTEFLPGTLVDVLDFEDMNEQLIAEGKTPAEGSQAILGITKAALATNSFLSAASFQETTKVLTEAAIKGKVDPLIGLKENVILGKLIPAGTGMKRYRGVKLNTDESFEQKLADMEELAVAVSEDYEADDLEENGSEAEEIIEISDSDEE